MNISGIENCFILFIKYKCLKKNIQNVILLEKKIKKPNETLIKFTNN